MENIKVPSKDEIIVRQSQMERSIEIMAVLQKEGVKLEMSHLLRVHQLLNEFIWTNQITKEMKDFDLWLSKQQSII
jgi:hypothetical protein